MPAMTAATPSGVSPPPSRPAMDGVGTLTIRTSRDKDCVLVEICDTGPGVPQEIRNRIFEPFFTTKPFGEGTGLGLDISWRIVVNKHHGDIGVESQPGDTRFQVWLPLTGPEHPDGSGSDLPIDQESTEAVS